MSLSIQQTQINALQTSEVHLKEKEKLLINEITNLNKNQEILEEKLVAEIEKSKHNLKELMDSKNAEIGSLTN